MAYFFGEGVTEIFIRNLYSICRIMYLTPVTMSDVQYLRVSVSDWNKKNIFDAFKKSIYNMNFSQTLLYPLDYVNAFFIRFVEVCKYIW